MSASRETHRTRCADLRGPSRARRISPLLPAGMFASALAAVALCIGSRDQIHPLLLGAALVASALHVGLAVYALRVVRRTATSEPTPPTTLQPPAAYDPLTGLVDLDAFLTSVDEWLHGGFDAEPFALLSIGVRGGDASGAVADVDLRTLALRLQGALRGDDVVARTGPSEFAVALRPVGSRDELALLVRRLLDGLQAPCDGEGRARALSAHAGIALAPADGVEAEQLFGHATAAAHGARALGRGTFRFFEPALADREQRHRRLRDALRGALERGEFSLVYQPQIDVATWQVCGFEALLRWRHPALGEVGPNEFVPVAAESGLIEAIGGWALREACRQAARWPSDVRVAVNVSAAEAMSPSLPARISATLRDTRLPPGRLEIEVTEAVFLNESPATLELLQAVRTLGVRVALDDFGTGYSSLAYLRRFNFHTLKLDRPLLHEVATRREARAILRTIVGLAKSLQITTVAEGVESPAQIEVLQRYGCNVIQGFFVAQPLQPESIEPFLFDWALRSALPVAGDGPLSSLPMDIEA